VLANSLIQKQSSKVSRLNAGLITPFQMCFKNTLFRGMRQRRTPASRFNLLTQRYSPPAKPTSRRFRAPRTGVIEMSDPVIPVSAHFCTHTVLVTGRKIALNGSAGEQAADCAYPLYLDKV
jgi:hypothetical protein